MVLVVLMPVLVVLMVLVVFSIPYNSPDDHWQPGLLAALVAVIGRGAGRILHSVISLHFFTPCSTQ